MEKFKVFPVIEPSRILNIGALKTAWAVSLSLLLFLVLIPFSTALAYDGKAGSFVVKTNNAIVVTDAGRSRKIPIKAYYPDGKGPFPLILYSHGLGGSKEGKKYLGEYWASHGYVGLFMTHFGSDRSLLDKNKSREENVDNLRRSLRNPKALTDRPLDVTAVINSLADIISQAPELKGKIDKTSIGLSGHSFGAYTVLISSGAWANVIKARFDKVFKEARVSAFLAMSPQSPRQGQDRKKIFSTVDRPMMTMTGSKDISAIRPQVTAISRLQPYENMPPGDKYSLWIEGAHHWTFGDGRPGKEPDPKHHLLIKIASLAFWDAYLKNDSKAKKFLTAGNISRISGGQARLDFK